MVEAELQILEPTVMSHRREYKQSDDECIVSPVVGLLPRLKLELLYFEGDHFGEGERMSAE